MQTRVATIGIIVEDWKQSETINAILHEYGEHIIGRLGIPYHRRHINIINIVIDAPQDIISALSGKLGRLSGVTAKTAYSNAVYENEE